MNDKNAHLFSQCRSVSAKEISDFILSGKYVAIALVDQHKLRYDVVCISIYSKECTSIMGCYYYPAKQPTLLLSVQ